MALSFPILIAQATQTLPDEEIEVLKSFEARLAEMNKISLGPQEISIDTLEKNYSYNLQISPLEISYPPPYIRPRAMNPDTPLKSGYGYVKGGYGNMKNPLGILRLNKAVGNYYNFGLGFDYLAFDDDQVTNKMYRNLLGKVNIDYFLSEATVANLNLYGGAEEVHFYGFNRGMRLNELGESMRKYTRYGFSSGIYNHRDIDSEDFKFEGKVNYDYIKSDDLNRKEHNTVIEGGLYKYISSKSQFYLKAGTDLTIYRDSISKTDHHYYIGGDLDFNFGGFRLQLGGLAKSDSEKFHIFPNAEISAEILRDKIFLTLGAKGDLRKNSYRNIVRFNPYFDQNLDSLQSTKGFHYFGEFRGQIGYVINFSVEGGYQMHEDYALFLNDPSNPRQFHILYDDMDIAYYSANLVFHVHDMVDVGLSGKHQFYTPQSEEEAWHLPQISGKVYSVIQLLNERLKITPELFVRSKVKFINLESSIEESDFLTDINLSAEFKIIDQFHLFLEGKNLSNTYVDRWYGYENIGRHFIGGGILRF